MADKVVDMATAVAMVGTGSRLGVGGVLLQRKPIAFLNALVDAGVADLRFHSFLASLDAELLAAHDRLSESHTGYVGFEGLGFAPAFGAAVDGEAAGGGAAGGGVAAHEYTEFLFVAGLRASLAGLPFMPAKGGQGSDELVELGYATITCPYTGIPLVAVPAMQLDVTVLHAEAADADGNVLGPADRDFLFDLDANMARAADRVVVTVERLVTTEEVRVARDRTLLFGFEVDAVVLAPRGAAPTGLPGRYDPDLAALSRYVARVGADVAQAAAAMDELTGRTTEVPR